MKANPEAQNYVTGQVPTCWHQGVICLPSAKSPRARVFEAPIPHKASRSSARARRPAGEAGSTGCTEGLGLCGTLELLPTPPESALSASPEPSAPCAAASYAALGVKLDAELAALPCTGLLRGLRLRPRLPLRLRSRLSLLLRSTLLL